jgi:DNA-binding NarL/FixJ family response regulator
MVLFSVHRLGLAHPPDGRNGQKNSGVRLIETGLSGLHACSAMRAPHPPMSLTPRQRQVLSLIAEGKTTREIAHELGLSPYTVKNYMERIYERLGAMDRVQAVSTALRQGLID